MLGDEEEPKRIYEHDLYVVKRMRDPLLGDVVVMKLHLPRDGIKEFVVPNSQVTEIKGATQGPIKPRRSVQVRTLLPS